VELNTVRKRARPSLAVFRLDSQEIKIFERIFTGSVKKSKISSKLFFSISGVMGFSRNFKNNLQTLCWTIHP